MKENKDIIYYQFYSNEYNGHKTLMRAMQIDIEKGRCDDFIVARCRQAFGLSEKDVSNSEIIRCITRSCILKDYVHLSSNSGEYCGEIFYDVDGYILKKKRDVIYYYAPSGDIRAFAFEKDTPINDICAAIRLKFRLGGRNDIENYTLCNYIDYARTSGDKVHLGDNLGWIVYVPDGAVPSEEAVSKPSPSVEIQQPTTIDIPDPEKPSDTPEAPYTQIKIDSHNAWLYKKR